MSEALNLESEVQRLTELVDRLTVRIVSLEDRLAKLERTEVVVSERAAASVASSPPASSTGWTALSSTQSVVLPEDQAGREELARHIGRFLKRGVSGEFRGSSGRDRLRLQNRYYLICKDFYGTVFEEPIFCSSFTEVRNQCKRGSDCGASLFVGFATLWEARIATLEAGISFAAGFEKCLNHHCRQVSFCKEANHHESTTNWVTSPLNRRRAPSL